MSIHTNLQPVGVGHSRTKPNPDSKIDIRLMASVPGIQDNAVSQHQKGWTNLDFNEARDDGMVTLTLTLTLILTIFSTNSINPKN